MNDDDIGDIETPLQKSAREKGKILPTRYTKRKVFSPYMIQDAKYSFNGDNASYKKYPKENDHGINYPSDRQENYNTPPYYPRLPFDYHVPPLNFVPPFPLPRLPPQPYLLQSPESLSSSRKITKEQESCKFCPNCGFNLQNLNMKQK